MYLTIDDFEKNVNPLYKPFFALTINQEIPQSMVEISQAYVEAVNLIGERTNLRKVIKIALSTTPFNFDLIRAHLICETKGNTFHVTIDDFVFIDINKIIGLPYPLIVASIVEEFVHSHMNIQCEELAANVVALVCPNIKYENNQYHAVY